MNPMAYMAISAHDNVIIMKGTIRTDLTSPTNTAPVLIIAIASFILLNMHITNTTVTAHKTQKK